MRKATLTAAALAGALILSGCSGQGEIPSPSPATETARAALSDEQFTAASTKIFDAIAASDAALDSASLEARAAGPFLAQRQAEYQLKGILADSFGMSRLSQAVSQSVVTSAAAYPHVALSIMDAPQGSNLQTIDVFAQDQARSLWKLWGVMSILPGATVPGLALGDAGATSISPDNAEGLVASPASVLAGYVTLNQSRSDAGGLTFADDSLRTKLASSGDANVKAVEGAGTASMTFAAGENQPLAVATADGGALVVAQMNFSTQISITTAGASVKIGSTIGALSSGQAGGEITVTGTMTANYTVTVAFHVPAAGTADQTIRVVGASDPALLSVQNG
ncbi:hypothetical protein I6E29_04920 [Arcanobacterium haemolyticum]|nr:hypothetical protein [Arcanobacterium haemolyticum]